MDRLADLGAQLGPGVGVLAADPPIRQILLNRLLPRLKFHHDFAAARVLAQCMADAFSRIGRSGRFSAKHTDYR